MLDTLIDLDKSLLLFCNSAHSSWFDNFFWVVSSRPAMLLVIVPLLFVLFYKKPWREALLIVVGIAIVVLLCDQFASSLCKPLFQRPRPTHDARIGHLVTLVNDYRGGRYGFISSHAANAFGAAIFLACIFRNRFFTIAILFWAAMVSYSRIYLGVHYPGDILAGAVAGCIFAILIYNVYKWARTRLLAAGRLASAANPYENRASISLFALYVPLSFLAIALVACA